MNDIKGTEFGFEYHEEPKVIVKKSGYYWLLEEDRIVNEEVNYLWEQSFLW